MEGYSTALLPSLQFVTDDLDVAMRTDALLKSHPIEVPINDPKEIEQVFDALSYYKGASVIRQLVAAIGSDAFKKVRRWYTGPLLCTVL